MLLVDLHIHQLGEGDPEEHLPRLQRQPVLRLQLLPIELVQDGVERLGGDGLEQVGQRVDGVALVGEVRGGGEEDQRRRRVELADLPRGSHAVHAGHEHVEQIQRKRFLAGRVQQLHGAAEHPHPHRVLPLPLPGIQQMLQGPALLLLVIADGNIHPPSPLWAVPTRQNFST